MEQEQNELPGAMFDPVQTENVCLEGCPYLGMRRDPSTSLGFPNEANRCQKSGKPAGIELAHQSGYCLSGQYKSCYIYVQPHVHTSPAESYKARVNLALPVFALRSLESLPSLKPRLEALKPRLDPLKLRLLSLKLRLLLFKLRLLSLMPSRSSLKLSPPPLEQNLLKLKQNFQSLNLDVDSLKSHIPSAKISLALNRFNVQSLNRQNVRLLALPLMLLLILTAAIIWWPPPGESQQDAVVMGASIANEVTGSSLEVRPEIASSAAKTRPQSESDAALLQEPAALAVKAADREANDQAAAMVAEKDLITEDDQESSAASADSIKLTSPAAGDTVAAEEGAVEALPEPANSVAVVEESAPETAVVGDDAAVELQQTEAEDVAGVEQEEEPGAIAPEQLEQVEAESADAVESDAQESDDAPQTAAASSESAASSIQPVAAIASIGPSVDEQALQDLYKSPLPLYLHLAPGDGTEVVAKVTEKQPATILGRDSSGEWLLVRLARGIEGWVNAVESGADIIVSNLPAVDSGAGAAPEPPAVAAESPTPEVVAESPASEAGALPVLATAVVNIGALNVRSGPGLEYDSIGIVYNKQQVSLLEQPGSNAWVQVRLADGQQGWLNSNYLILAS